MKKGELKKKVSKGRGKIIALQKKVLYQKKAKKGHISDHFQEPKYRMYEVIALCQFLHFWRNCVFFLSDFRIGIIFKNSPCISFKKLTKLYLEKKGFAHTKKGRHKGVQKEKPFEKTRTAGKKYAGRGQVEKSPFKKMGV